MFYSQYILAKRGPLGTIWIAAHLDRRLRKQQITETDVAIAVRACPTSSPERPPRARRFLLPRGRARPRGRSSPTPFPRQALTFASFPGKRVPTESIINPDAPLALRLSGQLMLGVVRVYSRKVNYLFQDCSEALVKIKQAFTRDKDVDLPEGAETAPLNTITLPDNYDDLELFFEPGGGAAAAAAAAEDITLEDGDGGFAAAGGAFEEQYAYDDRIHGDVDDDFIVDEMDPGFHPTPGYRTPGAPPRPFGETDAGDRADVRLEDYDEAPQRSDSGDGFGADGFGEDVDHSAPPLDPMDGDDEPIAPLPLDDDLEDENGVRGTVVGFKTPPPGDKSAARIAEGKENAPHTGSTVVLEWGKTAQKAARPEPGKQKNARSRVKTTTMKLKFDAATILDRDAVSRAIRDASDVTKTREPGVVHRMADLADDDRPLGADEERDERGYATLGYYRDAHGGGAPPPEMPAEARAATRGAFGGRDPLMGHRASRQWLEARAGCVRALWARAGERRGAGFAQDARTRSGPRNARGSARGSVAGDAEDVARVVDFDAGFDDDGDFGGGFNDDAGPEDADAFTPGAARLSAARAASEALGSEPPTPAGAPSGHVDWSTATKRMLADVAPKLADGRVVKVSEMTSRRDERNKKTKVSRSEAARVFYQVLVLKTHGFVDLEQKRAYGDIDLVAGPKMVEAGA